MGTEVHEFPLVNIAKVEVITEEDVPKTYELIDVATEAEVTAYIEEGEEIPLRVKNVIKARNATEDIVIGYDIRLVSAVLVPEILAICDGGVLENDIEGLEPIKYIAPVIGETVERKPFTMNIYTEEKDADGSTVSIVKFSYKRCKGTPVNYVMQDGEFFAPELTIKSRPKKGESPVEIEFLDTI
jgi:hypothetical protein